MLYKSFLFFFCDDDTNIILIVFICTKNIM